MKLSEFEKITAGRSVRVVLTITDVIGASDYEWQWRVVERTFAKSDVLLLADALFRFIYVNTLS
jgi:hypothetical protein